jgi:hypothetical protein
MTLLNLGVADQEYLDPRPARQRFRYRAARRRPGTAGVRLLRNHSPPVERDRLDMVPIEVPSIRTAPRPAFNSQREEARATRQVAPA